MTALNELFSRRAVEAKMVACLLTTLLRIMVEMLSGSIINWLS